MKYIKKYESTDEKFRVGEYVWSKAFNKKFKIVGITDRYLMIEDEEGNRAEFSDKHNFIPEIEYDASKYNL